jgi:osmotically-inducible protein OsmY
MSDDKAIIDEIRGALDRDDRLPHPTEVAVSARESTVMLRGTVRSVHQRRAAVEIAKSVAGVDVVEDDLRVDPRDHWGDEELRGAALQVLISNDGVPSDRIDVTVSDGWLTLKGEVKHQHESDVAFDTVSQLPGVGGITNRIIVITAGIDG